MNDQPEYSVIVPAWRAGHLLPDTLGALLASDLPRARWELIVVDDASGDDTSGVAARLADRVVTLEGRPGGPGRARNAGARVAVGAWLVFIDADVRVHVDTLSRMAAAVARDPSLAALFGCYDTRPEAHGLISEYRNLMHHYVHTLGAGAASTFWAGCGAVRTDAFNAVGGFDTVRFPRPQIEDIDLGYRLCDAGGHILNDPTIQGTHLKRWTFRGMLRTDLFDRGIPWMLLLLERRHRSATTLNTVRSEQFKVALAAMAMVAVAAAAVLPHGWWCLVATVVLLALLAATNWRTYAWFAKERGSRFALAIIPLNLLYYGISALAAVIGIARYATSPQRPRDVAG